MKLVIPGGSGQVGTLVARAFRARGHEVVVLGRQPGADSGIVPWDGATLGGWAREIDGCDVVLNLAGRSVDCRYTKHNLTRMFSSRVDATRTVGRAIERASRPPPVWLQMSTATIYSHRYDAPNDDTEGLIGGHEPDAPGYWRFSVEIALAWERAQREADTPHTRKLALRSAMVMSPDRGGIFDTLLRLTRWGLGGAVAGGAQFVSWIHEFDFVRALEFLIERPDLEGPVNLAAPCPLPQREFMASLRKAWGAAIGLPATRWMVELGAAALRTDPELILKSRRVVPGRLSRQGFSFEFPEWPAAACDLVRRWRDPTASLEPRTEPVEH